MTSEATQSALVVTDRLDFFINALGVFSSILLGIFAILAAVLGFLVWKHEEMRKRAQEELKKIEELSSKTSSMYEQLGLIVETARAELMFIARKGDALSKLVENAEGSSKKIADAREEIGKISSEIKTSVNSLATISRFIPSTSPSPSPSAPPYPEYSPEVVKRAIKMKLDELKGTPSSKEDNDSTL